MPDVVRTVVLPDVLEWADRGDVLAQIQFKVTFCHFTPPISAEYYSKSPTPTAR
jgi:hypothetical protein